MKKLIFIMSLITTGLASANTNVGQGEVISKNETKKEGDKIEKISSNGCFPFTLSCGVPGSACGDSTESLVEAILDLDNEICGRA